MDCKFTTDLGLVTVNDEVLVRVAGYAALALKGIIRRVDDDDKDKAAFEAAGGQQGLYINWSALCAASPAATASGRMAMSSRILDGWNR